LATLKSRGQRKKGPYVPDNSSEKKITRLDAKEEKATPQQSVHSRKEKKEGESARIEPGGKKETGKLKSGEGCAEKKERIRKTRKHPTTLKNGKGGGVYGARGCVSCHQTSIERERPIRHSAFKKLAARTPDFQPEQSQKPSRD